MANEVFILFLLLETISFDSKNAGKFNVECRSRNRSNYLSYVCSENHSFLCLSVVSQNVFDYLKCSAGLPRSGKNIWKMKFFPGKGKVREFCGWSGKCKKDLESQGKVREFEHK